MGHLINVSYTVFEVGMCLFLGPWPVHLFQLPSNECRPAL